MPKIVMVNTVCAGSHGRLMADLQRTALQAGFETSIAFGRGQSRGESCLRVGGRKDVLLHVALTRLLDRHGRGSLGATRAFVRSLAQMKPDLLHLHNLHGYYLHVQTLFDYIRRSSVPTLWTLHDCWAMTGHCSHFIRADCQRWKTGCHHCPLRGEYPASALTDASRANFAWKRTAFFGLDNLTLAVPSKWLAGVVSDSFLQYAPCEVIPNGVDLHLFQPGDAAANQAVRAAYGVLPSQALLLAVASPFDARKGFDDALAVARIVGSDARLVFVGLSEKQRQGLPDNVTGLCRTDGPEALVSLYAAADCLINPTHEDTYPTVNMEAMACGTPVAAYAVGGCTEQLEQPCAVAVPYGNADALAKAALALASQKSALGGKCRDLAEKRFDRARALDSYIALYQRMTGA